MILAAVGIVKDEADIIGSTLRHLYAQGVDRVYLADGLSTDGTRDIYTDLRREGHDLCIWDDDEEIVHQAALTSALANTAGADGATFVLPFDADEFVYAVNGGTIAEALSAMTADVAMIRVYRQHTWELREVEPEGPYKVAFRWRGPVRMTVGNHAVNMGGEWDSEVLALREWKYRSFEHFCAKTAHWNEVFEFPGLETHHSRLAGFTEEQMRAEWERICSAPTVLDPIPSTLDGLA